MTKEVKDHSGAGQEIRGSKTRTDVLPCQPSKDPAQISAGMFPQQAGFLQKVSKEKVYLKTVHLREKKGGNLSSLLASSPGSVI